MRFKEMFESSNRDIKKLQKIMENHLKKNGFDPKQLEIKIDSSSWDTRQEEFHFSIHSGNIGWEILDEMEDSKLDKEFRSDLMESMWIEDEDEFEQALERINVGRGVSDIIIYDDGEYEDECTSSLNEHEDAFVGQASFVATSLFVRSKNTGLYDKYVKALDLDKYI